MVIMIKSNIKGEIIKIMDTNIQKYLALIKTVEYGSFTKAAEMLSYSQSGISRMINDLEKEWKVSLLERSRLGVKPTSDGLKLLPHIKKLCGEYQKLQMQVDTSPISGQNSKSPKFAKNQQNYKMLCFAKMFHTLFCDFP